jgi:hypothetical protein
MNASVDLLIEKDSHGCMFNNIGTIDPWTLRQIFRKNSDTKTILQKSKLGYDEKMIC